MLSWLRLCTAHVHAHHSLGSPRSHAAGAAVPRSPCGSYFNLPQTCSAPLNCHGHDGPPHRAARSEAAFPETPRQTACSIVLTAQSWCARARTERASRAARNGAPACRRTADRYCLLAPPARHVRTHSLTARCRYALVEEPQAPPCSRLSRISKGIGVYVSLPAV